MFKVHRMPSIASSFLHV